MRKVSAGARKAQAAYQRFLSNSKVTTERLVDGWSGRAREAARGRHVLAIQDTSEIHIATEPGRRRGLGKVAKGHGRGFLLHAMLALDANNGSCLGLVAGRIWNRPRRVKKPHATRKLSEKESRRWLETGEKAKEVLAAAAQITVVADRESDIFAEWARLPGGNVHMITRVMHDRAIKKDAIEGDAIERDAIEEDTTLYRHTDTLPYAGESRTIVLKRDRRVRKAKLRLRFCPIAIRRPANCVERNLPKSVNLFLVDVAEEQPPKGTKPIHWRLLTTHAVTKAEEAWQIVDWYRRRWMIEQLFRVLKSQGLRMEDSQITDAQRLMKMAAIATHAAALTIQLTQARDGKSQEAADIAFSEHEIEALETLDQRYRGKTPLQQNPHPKRSLAWAAWLIARLGGWNGYRSDRPPGPITFKDGLRYFKPYADGHARKHVCMP